ncbi:MAG: hypothetical protein A4C66_10105 [Nitrospira sp. HN-bin3]|uniref:hypothetical protein n=1 Tax=Nitrospira cf. moscoviensis SBR1015 TaxID=96242 RepID=UPI000A0A5EC4|nr:hypothetical protein [Nitrospira cf. moscoviensis SBR1015]MBH0207440.1 hypothetical protein [Nitrospira sp.]OQW41320.1 MAG: hypothetical protein A4C66_10105 [Nitrospira sp. HN-bin3]
MTQHAFRWSLVSVIGIMVCMGTGCTRSIELKPSSTNSQPAEPRSLASDERVPLVMDSFVLSRNGAPQDPSTEAERRILNKVHETRLFSTVIPLGAKPDALGEKIVSARITVDEAIEPHSWLSAFKGILLGGSMFLLSPFVDFEYDYAARVGLELERWDGQIKRYEGVSSGTVQYKLFGAAPVMIDELKGHVTEACLTELATQLVRDTTLYMASSAPASGPGIRTVTVRAKRPSTAFPTRSSAPSVIPPLP